MAGSAQAGVIVLAVVGRSGAGKTTLLEGLVPELVRLGRRVATLKHTHHSWQDTPGSDSFRLREGGAFVSMLAGPDGLGLWGWEPPPETLVELAIRAGADCVLLEGYKHSAFPRLEVVRAGAPLLAPEELWGMATEESRPGVRCYRLRDFKEVAHAMIFDEMLITS